MPSNVKVIKSDFAGLELFRKALAGLEVVQVGIFGGRTARGKAKTREEMTNAEVGVIHEFGSFTRGLPQRSWLRMPLHVKSEQIIRHGSIGMGPLLAKGDRKTVLKRLGLACEHAIQQAFGSRGFGMWRANAPSTVRRKGSSSPLIATTQLRRSVASRVVVP